VISSRRSKAIGLFSGGLDSILAAKLMAEQGVEVIALHFQVPFQAPRHTFSEERLRQMAESAGASLVSVEVSDDYLNIVRAPRLGYARGMAPCMDCILYMLAKARELARQVRADFIFTGEVVGQRAHCQNKRSLKTVAKLSGIDGRLLRPLSAKLLDPTVPELSGLVRRERLLDLKGHGRRRQMRLASEFGILDYPQPTGGCLLTDTNFGARVRDAAAYGELEPSSRQLFEIGRHFRLESTAKLVVGRNQGENERLAALAREDDVVCRPVDVMGPVVLLRGIKKTKADTEMAARLCARYSDGATDKAVKIDCGGKATRVKPLPDEELRGRLVQAPPKEKGETKDDDSGDEGEDS